ncbi:cytochrome c1 [Sulfurivermis fontis]|uniref:cytochrome c1 n=1 Tax=Sulfurivermis fontis TaxID=1972068 RepID=UPI000FD8220D|nr:cytochrome c1 [Sulfurivermis fontis]
MKKLVIAFVMAALPAFALAAGAGVHLDKAPVNLRDQASLQRGAQMFVNYCLSCHSAQFMRFNRMGADLGISDEQLKANMMFGTDKVGDTMTIAMAAADSKGWFGNPPPDLSVIARARGADWLYTYMRTFYLDEKKPMGVNNLVFPDVGMPHVLWELQGLQKPVYHTGEDGHATISGFEMVKPGTMTPAEYDAAVGDLVNFLVYMGEPVQLKRQELGVKVLIFLAFFFVLAYLLKKEYWKDVH